MSEPRFTLQELHVVAHTHWDREWYHTAERFLPRLVALIDELLDDPPPEGESFLLDGQAILLDDYLSVRPERAAELSTLLRERRLEAGPWYVLADELIPSGEALVRNLLAGRETVRRLRGDPPAVLYCPDSFGHPAALPDLARGFGCDVVVLWRGYGGHRWPAGDTVRWRGSAGAEVVLYHLPPDGYEFGSSLPVNREQAKERWAQIAGVLGPRATTGVALLLNGADHHARQPGLRDAIAASRDAAAPVNVHASTLASASRAIADAARRMELPVVEGELRDSYGYTWTLQGTLAARAHQKRQNALVERLLVRDVEPWIALQPASAGDDAARALLRLAWRTLLRAHPHDTLCGTAIDDVARAMDARLAEAAEQGRGLRDDALLALLAHDRERAQTSAAEWEPVVMLRNPAPRRRSGVAELTLSASVAQVKVGPGSAGWTDAARKAPAWQMDGARLQLLERDEGVELTESPRAYPRADRVARVRALAWIDEIDGYTVETRPQQGRARGDVPKPVSARDREMDNGILRVIVREDGVVRMEDRAAGRVIDPLFALENTVDVGDLYTPAPRAAMPAPQFRRARLLHRGPLRAELALEYALASGSRCTVHLQLDANLPALRLHVRGDNRASDHRLRLHVTTGLAGAATLADAAFHPVLRVPLAVPLDDQNAERVVTTAPLHRWVARFAGDRGATLFSDGLAEYESLEDGRVAVTLLRATDALSRPDLPERPGHAGWPAETPDAQSIGPYDAHFALALHGGDTPAMRDEIERLADDLLLPITGETLRSNLAPPHRGVGLELIGDGLAFSTAAPAQRSGWTVLRCVNRRAERVQGAWRIGRPISDAVRARLDETTGDALRVADGVVAFEALAHEIVTVLVRLDGSP
ncbi:MAG TPA: glycoside hydrolase family 38 C-terminal domain-containing protein [Gemmatimonadaceae bacterium]